MKEHDFQKIKERLIEQLVKTFDLKDVSFIDGGYIANSKNMTHLKISINRYLEYYIEKNIELPDGEYESLYLLKDYKIKCNYLNGKLHGKYEKISINGELLESCYYHEGQLVEKSV